MDDKSKALNNLQTALSMEMAAVSRYLLHILKTGVWGQDRRTGMMRANRIALPGRPIENDA